jgi:hypothetical protein
MSRHQVASLGSISHGTLRSEDLVPALADELRRLRGALPLTLAREVRAFNAGKYDTDHGCDVELINDLCDALNGYAPDYCYFGAHPGDGADFGFWLCEDWQQNARDDGVPFIAAGDAAPDAPVYVEVTDHGNVTLYARRRNGTFREVWSVV